MRLSEMIKSFIKKSLNSPDDIETEKLKAEYVELRDANENLRRDIESIRIEVTE